MNYQGGLLIILSTAGKLYPHYTTFEMMVMTLQKFVYNTTFISITNIIKTISFFIMQ